jgi:ankyrin repeat protein
MMKQLALALIAVLLGVVSLPARQANADLARLGRALERIERNDVRGLRRLLAEDPSLVRRTEAGVLPHWQWTLLHAATADTGSLEIVRALIEAGSDVNAKDNEGNTPLHFAMKRISRERVPQRDYEGIIRLLIEKKADIRALNVGGATPLHTAAAFRADPSAVEVLLQAGAEVNRKTLQSYDGWTPLHGATAGNSAGIVAVLLKYGADLTTTDAKGLTALQVAERGGFADAARVIRAAAAGAAPPKVAPPPDAVAPPSTNVTAPAPNVGATPAGSGPATGGTVQGRVLWNGQPVAGATVYVADNPPGSARYGTVSSDDHGRFVISGVPEGNRFVAVHGNPQIFATPIGAAFTMTASPFTRDFHLCKGFDPTAPSNNESVAGRPLLQWNPYPDAARYFVVVVSQGKSVFSRGGAQGYLTATSVQVDVDLPPGAYQWRVYAYTAGGQNIGCSFAPRGFVVRPS